MFHATNASTDRNVMQLVGQHSNATQARSLSQLALPAIDGGAPMATVGSFQSAMDMFLECKVASSQGERFPLVFKRCLDELLSHNRGA